MRHDKYHDHLRRVPIFGTLAPDELEHVASVVTDLRFGPDRTLVKEGAAGEELMIIVSGTARVTSGGEFVADVGPGDSIGEMALLTGEPRNASVTTTSPVELLHIDRRAFDPLLQDVPGIAIEILRVLAGRAAPLAAAS